MFEGMAILFAPDCVLTVYALYLIFLCLRFYGPGREGETWLIPIPIFGIGAAPIQ